MSKENSSVCSSFLSQIFDYGNTDIERRSVFFKLLHPLLTYGRERVGVDLSALRLTAYTIKNLTDPKLNLGTGDAVKIEPTQETGSGQVQDKQKVALQELIERVNDLFEGDLSPNDKLVYVNNALKGKLLEDEELIQQAVSNTKEQFASSPDLDKRMEDAIIVTMAVFDVMGKQALQPKTRQDLKEILLGPAQLYELLRAKGAALRLAT